MCQIMISIIYGFVRNLLGGIIWFLPGSLGCALVYFLRHDFIVTGFFVTLALVSAVLYGRKGELVQPLARTCADALLNEYLHQGCVH